MSMEPNTVNQTTLPTRALASTGLRITEIGFGAASLGNLYRETSEAQAQHAVERAWDLGIRYFDTAPHYGLGLSERRLGTALKQYPRDEYVLSTKVGRLLVPNENPQGQDGDFVVPDHLRRQWDFSQDGIRKSLEESLDRLRTDRIDVLYAHDPDQNSPDSAWQAAETLTELRDCGVIGARGIGTNSAEQLAELFAADAIDVAMLAGRFTLLEAEGIHELLETATKHGKSIVAVGVLNSGLLANPRPPADAHYNYAPAPAEMLARANRLADVCEAAGVSLPQAAIAYPLRHPSIANVTLGMRTPEQVERNIALYRSNVPVELWSALENAHLLPLSVP